MNKKRILVLHANVPFETGGAELQVNTLVSQLNRHGFEAELFQLPYKWYPKHTLYDNMLLWRMTDLSAVSNKKVDLVIGTKFPSYGAVHPNKVVWLIHQYRQAYDLFDTPNGLSRDPDGREIRKTVMQFDETALHEAKLLVTDSQNVTDRLKEFNGIASEPLYHPPSLAGRYQSGEYGGYILSVGRLDPLKRNRLLLESLAHCGNGVRAKIAGRGAELEPLQKLAKSLGIEDRVDFLGFVPDEDLIRLYAGAFAVFFAPVDEDYGYITLEAFLSQRPVVTCADSGGVLEFVKDGESGFVRKVEPQALAQAIQCLYDDREKCRRFGQAGYDMVKDISWEHVIQRLTATL